MPKTGILLLFFVKLPVYISVRWWEIHSFKAIVINSNQLLHRKICQFKEMTTNHLQLLESKTVLITQMCTLMPKNVFVSCNPTDPRLFGLYDLKDLFLFITFCFKTHLYTFFPLKNVGANCILTMFRLLCENKVFWLNFAHLRIKHDHFTIFHIFCENPDLLSDFAFNKISFGNNICFSIR